MGNESFDGQALSEKLSKLNNSQQSIESLSRWCISHRKKAKQIVETWDKFFNSSQKEQRISFLYLANDILQNSRRKGSEFVNEFWKVLPAALKHVYENGDESGIKVVTRLVDIWEGRKVFGSRGQSLKDEMLAKTPPPISTSQVKSPNPIKIAKRDANSVRIKLAVGSLPEKIITAFESVLNEHLNEEAALNKCSTALQSLTKIEEHIENSLTQGNQLESGSQEELQEQENILVQCIEKLESTEAIRISLVSQLKEALQEQELKLSHIRTQLQVARRQTDQSGNIGKSRTLLPVTGSSSKATNPTETSMIVDQTRGLVSPSSTQPQSVAFAPLKASTDDESKKATAAAVANMLAASTSSAQMLTSVLSSLVAEEAASMNGGLTSMFSPEKRQKLEKPMAFSDANNSDPGGAPGFFTPTGVQSTFPLPVPSPPLPPSLSQSAVTPTNQYAAQSNSLVPVVMPSFEYVSNTLPPPPPMPPHFSLGMARPNLPTLAQPQHSPQQQLQPPNGAFYRPPGMGFYGQGNQPTTPPVHRQ